MRLPPEGRCALLRRVLHQDGEAVPSGAEGNSTRSRQVPSSPVLVKDPCPPTWIMTPASGVPVAWSLFQLWYASPLPFLFGFGVFNNTEARSIHLAFAMYMFRKLI